MSNMRHGHAVGHRLTPEYVSWRSMKVRCTNAKRNRSHNYVERGIRFCERWSSFETFLADMGPRPEGTSLERNDNDGDYEPGNCRWATPKEQGANTSKARRLTVDGITDCMAGWARRTGVPRWTIARRLARGFSPEQAVSQ